MGTPNYYSKDYARKLGFRSGFEVAFAKELEEIGVKYEYESDRCVFTYFRRVSNGGVVDGNVTPVVVDPDCRVVQWCEYTCDFLLRKGDGSPLYIETKGRFLSKDRTKHKLLKQQFPDVDIRLLFSENGKVSNKTRYLDWAASNNITAALIVKPTKKREGKYIPREWLSECDITYQN